MKSILTTLSLFLVIGIHLTAQPQLVREHHRLNYHSEWKDYIIDYQYDSNGNLIKIERNHPDQIQIEENEYNIQNILIKTTTTYTFTSNGSSYQVITLYTPNGCRKEEQTYTYQEDPQIMQLTYQIFYHTNTQCQILSDSAFSSIDSVWQLSETIDYQYIVDSFLEIKTINTLHSSSLTWHTIIEKTYHNQNGQKIKKQTIRPPYHDSQEIWEYDEFGAITYHCPSYYKDSLGSHCSSDGEQIFENSYNDKNQLIQQIEHYNPQYYNPNHPSWSVPTYIDTMKFNYYCDGSLKEKTKHTTYTSASNHSNLLEMSYFEYAKGINCPQAPISIHIFPNPTTNILIIKSPILNVGNTNIYIFDTIGRLVYQTRVVNQTEFFHINIENLHDGVYVLSIENESQKASQKVIKQ